MHLINSSTHLLHSSEFKIHPNYWRIECRRIRPIVQLLVFWVLCIFLYTLGNPNWCNRLMGLVGLMHTYPYPSVTFIRIQDSSKLLKFLLKPTNTCCRSRPARNWSTGVCLRDDACCRLSTAGSFVRYKLLCIACRKHVDHNYSEYRIIASPQRAHVTRSKH